MLDSASEVFPVAMLYVDKPPYSKVAADYTAAGDMLKAVRPYVTRFSSSGYIDEMAAGSLCLVMGYSGDINIARQRAIDGKTGQDIVALVPKKGSTLFFDSMAIPVDAPHPRNAHLFINYIMRPEVHAALTNKVFYANPNAASQKFVVKNVAENKTVFLSADDMKNMTAPDAVPQDIRRVQTRLFTSFKAKK
jgi:putrescine transport system substrate-binding protein